MNLDADILERPAPAALRVPDPRIAVAEARLCMLSGLMAIGMRFARFIHQAIAPSPKGPGGPSMAFRFFGDCVAAFNRVWRAVRLAGALMLRIMNEIDALKAGKPFDATTPARDAPRPNAGVLMDKIRQIGLDALAEDLEGPEGPARLVGDLHADPREEREDPAFYRLLKGPLKDAVAAICSDLGLKPDWSLWTEDGFPPPPGGGKEDWVAFFVGDHDMGPPPPPERPPPLTPPRAGVRDPRHVLDPPRRDLNAFLAAQGIQPLPPPPGQRSACTLPRFALRPPRGGPGLPTSL